MIVSKWWPRKRLLLCDLRAPALWPAFDCSFQFKSLSLLVVAKKTKTRLKIYLPASYFIQFHRQSLSWIISLFLRYKIAKAKCDISIARKRFFFFESASFPLAKKKQKKQTYHLKNSWANRRETSGIRSNLVRVQVVCNGFYWTESARWLVASAERLDATREREREREREIGGAVSTMRPHPHNWLEGFNKKRCRKIIERR